MPTSPAPSAAPHAITQVRALAQRTGQQALLLLPVTELVARVLPYSRRGARLLERLGLESPSLRLSTLLSQLTASTAGQMRGGIPRVLVDRLAIGLLGMLQRGPPPAWDVTPALLLLKDRLLQLRAHLLQQFDDGRIEATLARLTLELSPPALFYSEGRGFDAVPSGLALGLSRLKDAPLQWSAVRGPMLDVHSQIVATERALDIVLDPMLDEQERLLAMLSAQRIVKVAHVGAGGVRVTLPEASLAEALGLSANDAERGHNTFVVHARERALELLAALALRDDVVVAWSAGANERITATALRPKDLRVRFGQGHDWLNVQGGAAVGASDLASLASLLEALREGRRYVVVKPGQIAAISDELAVALAAVSASFTLPAWLAAADHGLHFEGLMVDELKRARDDAAAMTGEPPAGFVGELRGYQREGLRFLRRVTAWGTGGVLADDMGLGKTRTALAFLTERAAGGPQLVVCPTSVMHAWLREAQLTAPSLRMTLYAGSKRAAQLTTLSAGDVVVASYGVVLRDIEALCPLAFATVVMDEAQQVKNATAARSKALLRLTAHTRIALSGTPLENHTGELWAVFHATSPGLFGTWPQFKARFAAPIEKDNDSRRKKVLARAIAPFLLRRTKAQVAPELPPKIEMDRVLELSPAERRAYDDLRAAVLVDIEQQDRDREDRNNDGGQKRIRMLAALTKLRLCACHPTLASDIALAPEDVQAGSKQHALVEILTELRAQGHHALVFSQFVRHLRLAQHIANRAGFSTLELVGDTALELRQQRVDAFQRGEAEAFFISLKAGGFGLTLTKASTVIHMDPWWNPAVQDQATDRAHRIGQTLPVTVVRLVAGGTLEETMLDLHAQKRALVDAVLEGTDRAGTLSHADLLALVTSTRRSSRDNDGAQELAEI